jgi:Concanavalin A-like lectin/glucanases superfamily/IPT/TIG domain
MPISLDLGLELQSGGSTPLAAPIVSGLSQSVGNLNGGYSITITGANFTNASAVNFGSTPATSFVVNSPTQIAAVMPAAVIGTVHTTVTTPNGTSSTSSADQFTFNPTYAVSFNGSGYMSFSDAALPNGNSPATISFWINNLSNPGPGSTYLMFGWGTVSGVEFVAMFANSGFYDSGLAIGNNSAAGGGQPPSIFGGTHHLLAMTLDQNLWTLFVDGVYVSLCDISGNLVRNAGAIGSEPGGAYNSTVVITDVRVYNNAITGQPVDVGSPATGEIAAIYNNGNPQPTVNPVVSCGIAGWFNCQEDTGTTAHDTSGNGHNATWQGTGNSWVTF